MEVHRGGMGVEGGIGVDGGIFRGPWNMLRMPLWLNKGLRFWPRRVLTTHPFQPQPTLTPMTNSLKFPYFPKRHTHTTRHPKTRQPLPPFTLHTRYPPLYSPPETPTTVPAEKSLSPLAYHSPPISLAQPTATNQAEFANATHEARIPDPATRHIPRLHPFREK